MTGGKDWCCGPGGFPAGPRVSAHGEHEGGLQRLQHNFVSAEGAWCRLVLTCPSMFVVSSTDPD